MFALGSCFFFLSGISSSFAVDHQKLDSLFQDLHIQKIYRPFRPAEFSLPDLQGKMHSLSDFRGKVTLLNFWATWCGPCRFELPSLSKLHQESKGQNFSIVAVAIDAEGASVVAPLVKEQALPFLVLLDPENKRTPSYDSNAIPVTYLIGKDGLVVGIMKEAIHWDGPQVRQLLELLLAQEEETALPKIAEFSVETQTTVDQGRIFLDVEVIVRNPEPGLQFRPPILKDLRGIRQTTVEQVNEVTRQELDIIQKTDFRYTLEMEGSESEATIGNILVAYKLNDQAFWETKNIEGVKFPGTPTSNKKLMGLVGGVFILALLAAAALLWKKNKKT